MTSANQHTTEDSPPVTVQSAPPHADCGIGPILLLIA